MPDPRPLLDSETLAHRIRELGAEVRAAHGPDVPITCIAVLKGSVVFLADLIRAIPGPLEIEFLGVSSYEGTSSTGVVRITHDLHGSIEGKHCVIVEDILDTGLTLSFLRETLAVRNPASLRICTLLDKPSRRKVPVEAEFVGFQIPNAFVVGFGLDLDERFRNLPYVGIYEG